MAFDRDRGNRGGGGRSFGRRDFGGRPSFDKPREMTKVTCSECGKETEVPFKPTGDRPVYCRECFAKMGGPEERRSFNRNDSRPSFRRQDENRTQPSNSVQLNEINAKLDQLIKLLSHSETSGQAPVEKVEPVKVVEPKPAKVVKEVKEKKIAKKKAVKKIIELPVESPTETPEEV